MDYLEQLAESFSRNGTPFWLGVGFHKPHLPFNFPYQFASHYPLASVAGPKHKLPPAGMPLCAWHESGFNNTWGEPTPDSIAAELRRAHYSAVSYVDHNIGLVLDKLDALGLTNST